MQHNIPFEKVEEVNSEVIFGNIIIKEAETKGISIIRNAQLEAANILSIAQREGEVIRANSIREGEVIKTNSINEGEYIKQRAYEEGYNKGLSEGNLKGEAFLEEAKILCQRYQEEYNNFFEKSQEEIVTLAITIAEKILKREIQSNQKSLYPIIKESLKNCPYKNNVLIQVSPEDFHFMSENLEDLNTELGNAFEITLIPNPLRERGFLFIETPSGQINASIDTQLKNLKEHLMKVAEKKYE